MTPHRPFHGAWLAGLCAPLAFLSCQSCGQVHLAGDSAEADLPVSICGNGVVEPDEECDGGRRICEGPGGCGSGNQECGAECTWGDCVAAEFKVISGPILVSGDYIVKGLTGNLLWRDGRFMAFYLCREESAAPEEYNGCHSTIDGDGIIMGPSFIFAPSSILDASLWDVTVVHAFGSFPFAVIFDPASTGPAVFDFIDVEGILIYETGIPIHPEYINGYLIASREDGFIAHASRQGDILGGGFMTFDGAGEFSGLYIPSCPLGSRDFWRTTALSTDDGYTSLFICLKDEDLQTKYSLGMIHLDPRGSPMGEPITILDDQDVFFDGVGAAYTGSLFGIVYHGFTYVNYNVIVDLKLAFLDDAGRVVHGPLVIGKIDKEYGFGNGNSAIVWTGSELGVAFAEPLSEMYGDDFRTMVKLVRLDGEGDFIGEPLDIYGESHSHTIRVAWNGSRYGVSWNEPFLPSEQSRLHFALLGCADPD